MRRGSPLSTRSAGDVTMVTVSKQPTACSSASWEATFDPSGCALQSATAVYYTGSVNRVWGRGVRVTTQFYRHWAPRHKKRRMEK